MRYSLNLEELTTVLRNSRSANENHHLMFLLAFRHGLRVSEVANLTPRNIVGTHLRVQRLKHSLLTTQPLIDRPDPLWDSVAPIMRRLAELKGDPDAPLFPSPRDPRSPISRFQVRRLMRRYGIQAGIPTFKLHPHVLKSTCGTMAIKQLRIDEVKIWLGHRSLSSTGAYLIVSEEEAGASIRRMSI